MKTIILSLSALLLITIAGCKKERIIDGANAISLEALKNNLISGQWQISLLKKNGIDKTNDFAGYKFVFSTANSTPYGGKVTASTSVQSFSGTWYTEGRIGTTPLIINFDTTITFEQLTNDWIVYENKFQSIKMVASFSPTSKDELYLEKK